MEKYLSASQMWRESDARVVARGDDKYAGNSWPMTSI